MNAAILQVASALPVATLDNAELAASGSNWSAESIEAKTGIIRRHVAAKNECTSDLAVAAAQQLFAKGACQKQEIDYLILCTQTPDYLLPNTACLVQERLGLGRSVGAIDVNLGCSGYVYALGLAKGLIETGQASRVLLITADTYSKLLAPDDFSVRSLFGDGATATLLGASPANTPALGPFVYGTDGSGAENLIARGGGLREPGSVLPRLTMNGPEIFSFTLSAVPRLVRQLMAQAEITPEDIDLFVFHQANRYMLEHLRDKLSLPDKKFPITLREQGNTVSSSVPMALDTQASRGELKQGARLMLVGFGVGYSWGATLATWQPSPLTPKGPSLRTPHSNVLPARVAP
jgi:3-oxoacyl-[acyl-carrier-protein] synthase-3